MELPFTAYDAMATEMASIPAGTIIECKGPLKHTTWTVGNQTKRERFGIEIESVKVKGREEE